jgi:hypothetical protein
MCKSDQNENLATSIINFSETDRGRIETTRLGKDLPGRLQRFNHATGLSIIIEADIIT